MSCIVQTKFVTSPRLDPGRITRALRCLGSEKLLGLTILRYVNLSLASVASCPADCCRSRSASSRDRVWSRSYRRTSLSDWRRSSGSFGSRCSSGRFRMLLTGSQKETCYNGCDRNCRFHKRPVTVAHWLGLHVLQLLNGKSRSCQSTTCSRRFVSHDCLCGRPVNSTIYFSCSARFTLLS